MAPTGSSLPVPPGFAALEVGAAEGISFVAGLRSSNPLRLLAPVARGPSVWAFTSSLGGGLVAGDETRIELRLDPGARCLLGSQSVGKVYRNPNARPTGHETRAELGAGSLLAWLPDPIQAFAGARYRQRQSFQLADGAGLVLLDGLTSGRVARGERWGFARYESRNEVAVGGRLRFLDAQVLDPGEDWFRGPFGVGRFNYFGLLVVLGPPCSALARSLLEHLAEQPVPHRGDLVVSGGPLDDGAVIRLAAERPETATSWLRERLRAVADLLGDDPWRRKW